MYRHTLIFDPLCSIRVHSFAQYCTVGVAHRKGTHGPANFALYMYMYMYMSVGVGYAAVTTPCCVGCAGS